MPPTEPTQPAPPQIPRTIWVLASAAFIIALGYGFIAPVLPQFASSFNVSMAAAGAVVSVFALARLLGAPGAGALVDKLGSRPVYLTGLSIVAVATFFVAFAQAYWHIVTLRFIAGFGSTMFTLSAQALRVSAAAARAASGADFLIDMWFLACHAGPGGIAGEGARAAVIHHTWVGRQCNPILRPAPGSAATTWPRTR